MREITCIQMDITTVCNMACKDCCCGINMGLRAAVYHPWEYFERVAPYIQGIDRVDLFGGEPTTHPQFREFVPQFKALFGCKNLTMTTNGFKVKEYADLLHHFDFIQATPYGEQNAKSIVFLNGIGRDVRFFPGEFIPRDRVGGGKPCGRGQMETVAYADGKFWPCTPGPGVKDATGIEPTADWKERILEHPMPCQTCFLSH